LTLGQTYHYDPATQTWTEVQPGLAPGFTSPTFTWGYGWCRTATGMLLSGGPSSINTDETWHWDGTSWSFITSPMPRRTDPFLAYDSNRNVVVRFGGSQPIVGPDDATWEFDGTDWQQVPTAIAPPARNASIHGGMTFDARRGRIVLVGGSSSAVSILRDVWEYDGQDWREVVPFSSTPAGLTYAVAYDEASERVVAVGNAFALAVDETWLFEGSRALCNSVGSGCVGSAGIPVLAATGTSGAAQGMRFDFAVTNSALGLTLLVAATTATTGVPLSLLGFPSGCLGYPTSVEASAVLGGNPGTFVMTMPWQPSLVGAEFFMQALCLDVTGTPVPFVVTNASRCAVY
jgi:hypothetical protein